jgi:hypothetical protein
MPPFTWQGLDFLSVSPAIAAQFTTSVTAVFLTQPRPFSAAQVDTLAALAFDRALVSFGTLSIVSPRSRTDVSNVDISGDVPWAATTTAAQWLIAMLAALWALLVVVSTGVVDALDRRADNRRLERLGATPNQLRAGSALNAGLELATSALLACGAVTLLAAWGMARFRAHTLGVAVPFVLPAGQFAALVLGVPVVGAGIAAMLARPAEVRRGSRRDPLVMPTT